MSQRKDKTLKKLEEYPDVAADIINGTIYDGNPVVKEEDLELQPTSVLIRDANEELRERLRDIYVLHSRNGLRYAYIGIGNQSAVDNTLPLRVVEVDAGAYRKQIDTYMDQNRKDGNDAWIKQIHDDQKLVPTMTVILYFGKEWTGPRTLLDMVDAAERERLEPYLLNYELNIIELGKDKELYKKFHSDFRTIVQYLSVQKDKEEREEFYNEFDAKIRHYREFLEAMAALTNDSRYRKLKETIDAKNMLKEGEETDMCWLMDMAEERGEERGRNEGIEEALLQSVQNLRKNLNLTDEQAMEVLEIPKDKREAICKELIRAAG